MKFKIFKFNSVTSTNDVAINLIKNEKEKVGCVQANLQTRGRGTNGRKWVSGMVGAPRFRLKSHASRSPGSDLISGIPGASK